MKFYSAQCPSCGAELPPVNLAGLLRCHYCKNEFTPREARTIKDRSGKPLDVTALVAAVSQAQEELNLPVYERRPEEDPRYIESYRESMGLFRYAIVVFFPTFVFIAKILLSR